MEKLAGVDVLLIQNRLGGLGMLLAVGALEVGELDHGDGRVEASLILVAGHIVAWAIGVRRQTFGRCPQGGFLAGLGLGIGLGDCLG